MEPLINSIVVNYDKILILDFERVILQKISITERENAKNNSWAEYNRI